MTRWPVPDRNRASRRAAAAATVLMLATAGCGDPVSVRTDILIARMVGGQVELTSTSTRPVFYFAADREALAVADWAPCTTPATCEAVPPGATRRLARDEVAFQTPATREIVVYHWHLVPVSPPGDGFAPDEIRQLILEVR